MLTVVTGSCQPENLRRRGQTPKNYHKALTCRLQRSHKNYIKIYELQGDRPRWHQTQRRWRKRKHNL